MDQTNGTFSKKLQDIFLTPFLVCIVELQNFDDFRYFGHNGPIQTLAKKGVFPT